MALELVDGGACILPADDGLKDPGAGGGGP